MIISKETKNKDAARPVEEFHAADYVKGEVADAVRTLLRKSSPELPRGRGVIRLKVDQVRYHGSLLYDSDKNKILEMDEVIRNGARSVSFRDLGGHHVHELRIKDGPRVVYLRLVEEVETGLIFMTGFLMNKKEIQKLY